MTKKSEPKTPAMIAWHVREGKAGGKAYWTRIGAAWPHQNGDGFTVQLDLAPLDGKIVLLVNRHAILTPYRRPKMTPLERAGSWPDAV